MSAQCHAPSALETGFDTMGCVEYVDPSRLSESGNAPCTSPVVSIPNTERVALNDQIPENPVTDVEHSNNIPFCASEKGSEDGRSKKRVRQGDPDTIPPIRFKAPRHSSDRYDIGPKPSEDPAVCGHPMEVECSASASITEKEKSGCRPKSTRAGEKGTGRQKGSKPTIKEVKIEEDIIMLDNLDSSNSVNKREEATGWISVKQRKPIEVDDVDMASVTDCRPKLWTKSKAELRLFTPFSGKTYGHIYKLGGKDVCIVFDDPALFQDIVLNGFDLSFVAKRSYVQHQARDVVSTDPQIDDSIQEVQPASCQVGKRTGYRRGDGKKRGPRKSEPVLPNSTGLSPALSRAGLVDQPSLSQQPVQEAPLSELTRDSPMHHLYLDHFSGSQTVHSNEHYTPPLGPTTCSAPPRVYNSQNWGRDPVDTSNVTHLPFSVPHTSYWAPLYPPFHGSNAIPAIARGFFASSPSMVPESQAQQPFLIGPGVYPPGYAPPSNATFSIPQPMTPSPSAKDFELQYPDEESSEPYAAPSRPFRSEQVPINTEPVLAQPSQEKQESPALAISEPDLPMDIKLLTAACRSEAAISVFASRHVLAIANKHLALPEEYGYVWLGKFQLYNNVETTIQVIDLKESIHTWTFSGTLSCCIKPASDPDHPTCQIPWWMMPPSTISNETEVDDHTDFIPPELTHSACLGERDIYFTKGWFCISCGRVNTNSMMRHRKCSSSQCKASPISDGYARSIDQVRGLGDSCLMYRPSAEYPCDVLERSISTWSDGMLTCRYTSRDKSRCAIDLALLFTCNNPELQDDASELFVDLQMDIPLVRESATPFFSAKGIYPDWRQTSQLWEVVKEFITERVVDYAEIENYELDTLEIVGWVTSGASRGGSRPIMAKHNPAAIVCLGAEVTIHVTAKSPLLATSRRGDASPGFIPEQNYDIRERDLEDGMDNPTLDFANVDEESKPAITKDKIRSSGREAPFFSLTMYHGDIIVLFGDEFELTVRRMGTTLILIGSKA